MLSYQCLRAFCSFVHIKPNRYYPGITAIRKHGSQAIASSTHNRKELPMANKKQQKVSKKHLETSFNQISNQTFTGELPYTLTNDFFFKAFLQKNETALRGLLSALLSMKPEEIISITITNPIQEGDVIDDKNMILDLKVILNDSQIINLEMQVANLGNWPERSLTYLCRMFEQLKSGEDYGEVKKTVHISIMDFTPKDFPEVLYSEYFMYNPKTKHKYSDKFNIYMLQLNQLGNPDDEQNMPELYYWAQLFKSRTWEEIRMLAEKNEFIMQSIVTLQELTADEKARMQMEARERYRRDLAASKELGKQESEEMIQSLKGTIGEQQGTIEEQQGTIEEQQDTIEDQKHTIQKVQEEKERAEKEKERAEAEKEKVLEKNKQFEAKTKEADEEIQRLRKILEEHGLLDMNE